jgi:hypothetical protein
MLAVGTGQEQYESVHASIGKQIQTSGPNKFPRRTLGCCMSPSRTSSAEAKNLQILSLVIPALATPSTLDERRVRAEISSAYEVDASRCVELENTQEGFVLAFLVAG